jgi:hypothetical protein
MRKRKKETERAGASERDVTKTTSEKTRGLAPACSQNNQRHTECERGREGERERVSGRVGGWERERGRREEGRCEGPSRLDRQMVTA